ncbi:MAG: cytochrome P450 [Chloroflexota bacterium]|nr:cytochrome P450 [Chloroflexota bacterium]
MVVTPTDWLSQAFLADPYAHYRRLRETTPVYYDETRRRWLITRHADVLRVLRDDVDFTAQQQGIATSMLVSDPPQHTRLRTLVSKAFTPREVKKLEPRIHQKPSIANS